MIKKTWAKENEKEERVKTNSIFISFCFACIYIEEATLWGVSITLLSWLHNVPFIDTCRLVFKYNGPDKKESNVFKHVGVQKGVNFAVCLL